MKDWHKYFIYREDGFLIWKEREACEFSHDNISKMWNTRFAGIIAGCKTYQKNMDPRDWSVKFRGKMYGAHRLIWEMAYGTIPDRMQIDHINRNPFDNRLANLRLATNTQNNRNKPKPRNNTSGFKGVSFEPRRGVWVARITVGGRRIHIGAFSTPENASVAYKRAAEKYHGEFANIVE